MGILTELNKSNISSSLEISKIDIPNKSESSVPTKTIGLFKATFLVARSLIGVGVLAQPHMNNEFGFVSIAIAYPVIAAMIIYLLSRLPKIADEMNYKGASQEEFVGQVVGKKAGNTATFFILLFNISVSVCGVIFGVNFVNYSLCQLGSDQCGNMLLLNAVGLIACMPFAFIDNVAPFVYFTAICLVIIFTSLFTIGGEMVSVLKSNGIAHSSNAMNWSAFPEFFGMACFSLEGIGLIFPIRGSLKKPKIFTKLFIAVASFMVMVYIIFGTLANLALGMNTKQIIFHNFPKTYTGMFVLQFAYAQGIFSTFPLYVQACVNTIKKIPFFERFYQGRHEYWVSTVTRIVFIITMFLICMTGINLLDFMDLAGSVCNSYLAFVLPVMCYIAYYTKKGNLSKKSKYFHIAMALFGFTMSMITIGFSFKDMFTVKHTPVHLEANPLIG